MSSANVPARRSWPKPSALVGNALALMASSTGTALLGIGFWALAARTTDPRRVGKASAELAAMVLIASLADVGIGSVFVRFLPKAGARTRLVITRAYFACTTVGLVLAIVYVSAGLGDRFLPAGLLWRVVFVATTVFWTVFVLQDSALIGLRASKWVPVENILFAGVKIALLPLFLTITSQQGVFLAWSAPVVIAVLAVNLYLFRRRIPEQQAAAEGRSSFPTGRQLTSFVSAQYANGLVSTFRASLLPLIVIFKLGPTANAHFYLPWVSTSAFFQLFWNLSTSFVVEAAHDSTKLREHVDRAVRFALFLIVPAIVIGVALAPIFLSAFGRSYSSQGTTLLRLLLLGAPGTLVTAFYCSFAFLERRVWFLATRVTIASAVFVGTSFVLLGHFGIVGVGIASLITEAVQAVIILPGAVNRYRAARSGRVNELWFESAGQGASEA